eukprot:TRINITY_DN285_c0_g1_i4.p1 TRINITY_DN285_c0_g1~~TRINITY_DN285_c0_g1_i4.p1  ORF type:complete len:138 (+),score=33.21 TRINITY_DN285_c0_g1_i4:308-721(+)
MGTIFIFSPSPPLPTSASPPQATHPQEWRGKDHQDAASGPSLHHPMHISSPLDSSSLLGHPWGTPSTQRMEGNGDNAQVSEIEREAPGGCSSYLSALPCALEHAVAWKEEGGVDGSYWILDLWSDEVINQMINFEPS